MTRQEITEFYREHHGRLYNIAWRILGDSDDAEEVMQDTILKYVTGSVSLRGPQESAWLASTCIRAAIDRLRERRRRDIFLEEYAQEAEETVEEIPASALSVDTVKKALEKLTEPYRLVLDLVLIEGLDYEEISAYTGKKEVTIRSIYSRGREKLKKLLSV